MRRGLAHRRLLMLCAGVIVVVSVGVAYAAIPHSSTGVINGCYEKKTGILRVIDAQAGKHCLSFETPISWNQKGPKGHNGDPGAPGPAGATGPQGPAGPQGPQGLQGPSGADGAPGAAGPTGADGAQGPPGTDGTDGAPGATGPQGPVGPTLGRSAAGVCNPSVSGPDLTCASIAMTLPDDGRVLLVVGGSWHETGTPDGSTLGHCFLFADTTGVWAASYGQKTATFEDGGLGSPYNGTVSMTNVTAVLPAGPHTFRVDCRENEADITFVTALSAVALGAS